MPDNEYKDAMAVKVQEVTVLLQETRIKDLEDALRKARTEIKDLTEERDDARADYNNEEDRADSLSSELETTKAERDGWKATLIETLDLLGVAPIDAELATTMNGYEGCSPSEPASITLAARRLSELIRNTKDYRRAGSK